MRKKVENKHGKWMFVGGQELQDMYIRLGDVFFVERIRYPYRKEKYTPMKRSYTSMEEVV
jgi:hypothetical protein